MKGTVVCAVGNRRTGVQAVPPLNMGSTCELVSLPGSTAAAPPPTLPLA